MKNIEQASNYLNITIEELIKEIALDNDDIREFKDLSSLANYLIEDFSLIEFLDSAFEHEQTITLTYESVIEDFHDHIVFKHNNIYYFVYIDCFELSNIKLKEKWENEKCN